MQFGRPTIDPPDKFSEIVRAWDYKEIDFEQIKQMYYMSKTTFYRCLREYRIKKDLN